LGEVLDARGVPVDLVEHRPVGDGRADVDAVAAAGLAVDLQLEQPGVELALVALADGAVDVADLAVDAALELGLADVLRVAVVGGDGTGDADQQAGSCREAADECGRATTPALALRSDHASPQASRVPTHRHPR